MAADLVPRPRLDQRLERGHAGPLTLICAPAGYGKSTLVASRLEAGGEPYGWLSLDEADADPGLFVEYFVAAVRTVEPGAFAETLAALASSLPPEELADSLAYDLSKLDQYLVLVLDDYHRVGGTAVHDLMDRLLRRPPRNLHLEILTRWDPPLPIESLRAGGQLLEIRERDLRFEAAESKAFFEQALERPPEAEILARLDQVTEGWAVGMRLTALLAQDRDLETLLSSLRAPVAQLTGYFLAEVLGRQPPEMRDLLPVASLVEPFCAPLLTDLFAAADPPVRRSAGPPAAGPPAAGRRPPAGTIDGHLFLETIERRGLFLIAVDPTRRWYRFHHLFARLLRQQLDRRMDADEQIRLRRRAAHWLEANGYLEEAMAQARAIDDESLVAALIKRRRYELSLAEEWSRLDRWLDFLPYTLVRSDLELLLTRFWVCINRFRHQEIAEGFGELLELAARVQPPPELRGEIDGFATGVHFLAGDGENTVAAGRRALDAIPIDRAPERGFIQGLHILGLQMQGGTKLAEPAALAALGEPGQHRVGYCARSLQGLGLAYWMEGLVSHLPRIGRELLTLGREHGLAETSAFGSYLLGLGLYEAGQLAEAEDAVRPLAGQRNPPHLKTWTRAVWILALTRSARGAFAEAEELLTAFAARALQLRHPQLLSLAEAFRVDLALRRGRVQAASTWTASFRLESRGPYHFFYSPELTYAKALLACEEAGSIDRSAEVLGRLRDHFVSIHHQRNLAEVDALQALVEHRRGDQEAALDALRRAVRIAHPRGLVQLMLDLGPDLFELLGRLDEPQALSLRRRLAAASPALDAVESSHVLPVAPGGVERLSEREMEILRLLADRLSNKEIAQRLFISPATVKRHNTNIFEKLQAGGRRQAVEKAQSLGWLRLPRPSL